MNDTTQPVEISWFSALCDDHYEFLQHCDLSCYEEDGGDCVETPEPTSVPFEGCCFWSSSGDSCGDCDQPAANVDWCSFSRANCKSCSNAEWCGESDIAPHAPAPSQQPSPRPTPRPIRPTRASACCSSKPTRWSSS